MTALALLDTAQPATLTDLRDIEHALATPREQIESTFLTVGARLAEGAAMLNQVSKVFEALPAQLQSTELLEASGRLAEVGSQARTIAAMFDAEQADLLRLVTVVAAAAHPIAELRRTVKMMSIVAINARVVAASVADQGEDFDVFTTDIAKLSESATATIQDFTVAYHRLSKEVDQAALQRGQSENAHADTLNGLAAGMDEALEDLASRRADSVASTAETGRISRQIVGRIGSAVMALQVGDATRQRIEHVESGIADLCGLVQGDTLAEGEVSSARAAFGNLLASQLATAADVFESDVAEAGDALRNLAADASTIMAQSQAVYGQGKSGDSSLAALSLAVRNAGQVLRNCEAERGKLEEVASAVLSTVGVLLSHVAAVQEIEANMRLVSINAAIKCAQLGPRGAALNIIATQLRELTGETVLAAEASMASLHEAAGLARSFGAAANGETANQVGQLEAEASASLVLLESVDKVLAEALGALERDGPNVRNVLGAAADAFAKQETIAEAMRDLQVKLVTQSPPMTSPPPAGAIADALALHRKRYTMDGERRIHEQMFGADPIAGPSTADAADTDDVFF